MSQHAETQTSENEFYFAWLEFVLIRLPLAAN